MACSRSRAVLAIVAVTVVALATSANAAPIGQLGILDDTANGGINPVTDADWAGGDQYRLVFVSSTRTNALSGDIAYYNAHVQAAANAAGLGSVTWNAIASTSAAHGGTATVDARDNTSTNFTVVPVGMGIFLSDGTTKIADNYTDLWDNSIDNRLDKDEYGAVVPTHDGPMGAWKGTWAGTTGTGTNRGAAALGGNNRADLGLAVATNSQWIRRADINPTDDQDLCYVYGMSEALTIPGGGPGPGPGPVDIPIVNGSFELPAWGDGGYGLATGWDLWGPAADGGNWNPEDYQFSAGPPDGNHVGWAWQYAPLTGVPNGLTQVLGANFDASTDYSLSVEIGNAEEYYFGGYAVQLLAGGTVIAEDDNTVHPFWAEWATSLVNYTYDPAHAGLVGLPLEIRLLNLGLDPEGGGEDTEVEFDHVQLTALSADLIPEPATLSLLGLGALLALRRRRRQ